jgi:hypothetical protein
MVKSPMLMNTTFITDKNNYTDLQVLRSNAGYYIGTMYITEGDFEEPGTRDSSYFSSKQAADKFLAELEAMDDYGRASVLRSHP